MSRPKKDITKLSEQGVVTEEALVAYLNDKLTVTEKQELEKLLKDDPFAQDALEGLQSSMQKNMVAGSISSLNKKVRERTGLKEHKKTLSIHWTNYAWAAVILGLLIGIGFVMIGYLNKNGGGELAMNKKPAAEQKEQPILQVQKQEAAKPVENIVATDSVGASFASDKAKDHGAFLTEEKTESQPLPDNRTKPLQVPALSADQGKVAQMQKEVGTKTTGSVAVTGSIQGTIAATPAAAKSSTVNSSLTASNNDEKPTPPEKYNYNASNGGTGANLGNYKNAALAKQKDSRSNIKNEGVQQDKESGSVLNDVVVISDLKKEKGKTDKTEPEKAIKLDDAMKDFNSGDYKAAAAGFEKILNHQPDNNDALYFGGVSEYINGNLPKSEKHFDKLLKKGTSFVDGAKWYKANILIKRGAIEDGRKLLQDLANTSGSYKERAVKKSAELGF